MESLLLNEEQIHFEDGWQKCNLLSLNQLISKLEEKFGKDYIYQPEHSEFSCKCSGPAQSCVWH